MFVMEKSIEDVRQDEKHVPDLLEAIIQRPGLVKEELQSFVVQNGTSWIENRKIQGFNCLDPGSPKLSRRRPIPAFSQVGFKAIQIRINSQNAVRKFVNKSAASAASQDYVKFQAVIKSAASAASRKPKSRE